MSALKIAYKDPASLKACRRNPRTHTTKQVKQIAARTEQFGFVSPVLVDTDKGIIAGHGRVAAAKTRLRDLGSGPINCLAEMADD
jgi:ParB-like chromosome segregation protein Spo0J